MSRRLGQHYLVDSSYAARAVRASHLTYQDAVVEVGPGRGSLTNIIVQQRPRSLTLLELDSALAAALRERYVAEDWIRVVEEDARSVDPATLPGAGDVDYKLLGNLPYYAASPIIRNFMESRHPPSLMVVMVQREVAGEMAAQPGEMGLLSVCVQLYANVEKLFDVPPAAFRPTPKVTSSVVRLSVLPRPRLTLDSAESFFRLVRAGFRAPRKQMRNSFAIGLGVASEDAGRLLAAAGIDPSRRAATLSLSEWSAVYRVWREGRSPDQNLSL